MNTVPVLCELWTHLEGVSCETGAAQMVFSSTFVDSVSSCLLKYWYISRRPWPPAWKGPSRSIRLCWGSHCSRCLYPQKLLGICRWIVHVGLNWHLRRDPFLHPVDFSRPSVSTLAWASIRGCHSLLLKFLSFANEKRKESADYLWFSSLLYSICIGAFLKVRALGTNPSEEEALIWEIIQKLTSYAEAFVVGLLFF